MKNIVYLFLLLPVIAFSQSGTVFYDQSYHYYGPPFYYQGGLGIQKGDFKVVLPYAGVLFSPYGNSGHDIYGGFGFHYRQLVFDARAIQQIFRLKDRFQLGYSKSLSTTGHFSIGYQTLYIAMNVGVEIGNTIATNNMNNVRTGEKILTIRPTININGLIYDNFITKLAYKMDMKFDIMPTKNVQTYHFSTYIPMLFNPAYGWLEFLIRPGLEYNNFIKREDLNIEFSEPIQMYRKLFPFNNGTIPNYQFTTTVDMELRWYMKFFDRVSPAASKLFLNFFSTIGYAQNFDNQNIFFYIYGGGIGYNVFGAAPFALNFATDNRGELFFNISMFAPISVSI
ncbi:MAG: hypothetical protein ACRC0X_00110 [Brevinema sp.]